MSASTPTDPSIFKIFTPEHWDLLNETGQTLGSAHDQADGFLHFSTASQLDGTLAKHYAKAGPLILARIRVEGLSSEALKWEVSRNGDLFPHLYGALTRSQIDQHWPLSPNDQGAYVLPDPPGACAACGCQL
ncbi:MAG: DUF952 domain-containing protein, partial [Pseudomonadota bacterium]